MHTSPARRVSDAIGSGSLDAVNKALQDHKHSLQPRDYENFLEYCVTHNTTSPIRKAILRATEATMLKPVLVNILLHQEIEFGKNSRHLGVDPEFDDELIDLLWPAIDVNKVREATNPNSKHVLLAAVSFSGRHNVVLNYLFEKIVADPRLDVPGPRVRVVEGRL